jgi:hypothetical protein
MHQDGLDMVVHCMSNRHPFRACGPGYFGKKAVSNFTGGFFWRNMVLRLVPGYIPRFYGGWHAEVLG